MGSLEGRDSSHPAESLVLLLLWFQKQQRQEKGRDHFLQEKFKLDHKKDFLCHEIQLCPEPTSSGAGGSWDRNCSRLLSQEETRPVLFDSNNSVPSPGACPVGQVPSHPWL